MALRDAFQHHLLSQYEFTRGMNFAKVNVTMGRAALFAQKLAYELVAKVGLPKDFGRKVLFHVDNGLDWKWTKGVAACKDSPGWACIYLHPSSAKRSAAIAPWAKSAVDAVLAGMGQERNAVQFFLTGQMSRLLMRPSTKVHDFIGRHLVRVNNVAGADEHPAAAIHVRRGDSCYEKKWLKKKIDMDIYPKRMRPCYRTAVYVDALKRMRRDYGVRTVYVATDSVGLINQLHQNEFPDFNWVYLNFSRSTFNDNSHFIEFREDLNMDDVSLSFAAELELVSRADMYVGALSSNYGRLMAAAISGRTGTAPPFVSIDGHSHCCHVGEMCTPAGITKQGRTLRKCLILGGTCMTEDVLRSVMSRAADTVYSPCGYG